MSGDSAAYQRKLDAVYDAFDRHDDKVRSGLGDGDGGAAPISPLPPPPLAGRARALTHRR